MPNSDYPPPNDPHIVQRMFVPDRLRRARELAGLTRKELSDRIDKTPSAITQFEQTGRVKPDVATIAQLALALEVEPSFFARPVSGQGLGLEDCHFRSLRSVRQAQRRQAIQSGELLSELVDQLERHVEFPAERISSLKEGLRKYSTPAEAGEGLRTELGLGLGPISAPIRQIEALGVYVLPLAGADERVDAFSSWVGGRPFIFLAHKPSSRVHFDVAHELAHLLLHDDAEPGSRELESEANQFAGGFLLPRESFQQECPDYWSFETFVALKRRWYVSVQALLFRAHEIGRLSDWSYQRAHIEMSRRGQRKREDAEWSLARPLLVSGALELVKSELDLTLDDLAAQIGVRAKRILNLLW